MKDIEIFYQLEGATEILHITAPPDESFGALKVRIAAKHGLAAGLAIFLEDADDLVDEAVTVGALAKPTGCKVHLHRCRHIMVTVAFAGRRLEHEFRPATTVARVKHWAAQQLGMSKEDAGEHVLQLSGTHDRPTPSTHIGTLTNHPVCRVAFDLVPDERVNGAPTA